MLDGTIGCSVAELSLCHVHEDVGLKRIFISELKHDCMTHEVVSLNRSYSTLLVNGAIVRGKLPLLSVNFINYNLCCEAAANEECMIYPLAASVDTSNKGQT